MKITNCLGILKGIKEFVLLRNIFVLLFCRTVKSPFLERTHARTQTHACTHIRHSVFFSMFVVNDSLKHFQC